jgi:hypothetical protein
VFGSTVLATKRKATIYCNLARVLNTDCSQARPESFAQVQQHRLQRPSGLADGCIASDCAWTFLQIHLHTRDGAHVTAASGHLHNGAVCVIGRTCTSMPTRFLKCWLLEARNAHIFRGDIAGLCLDRSADVLSCITRSDTYLRVPGLARARD